EFLQPLLPGLLRFARRLAGRLCKEAEELGLRGRGRVVLLVEPVGVDEAEVVVLRGRERRTEEGVFVGHGHPSCESSAAPATSSTAAEHAPASDDMIGTRG